MATAAEGVEAVSAAATADGGKAKKGRGKLLVVGAVVLLLAGGGAAWFLGLVPLGGGAGGEGTHEDGEAAAEGGEHAPPQAQRNTHGGGAVGAMRPLDPFLANLADESGTRYLKMTLQVEFVGEPPAALDARMPQIRDLILTLVTSKTFADIRTPEGKERLREDVIERMNHALQQPAVKSVYFTEFIVQ
jgi:flagellar FliL protein